VARSQSSTTAEGTIRNSENHRRDGRQAIVGIALVVGMVLLVALAVGAQRAGLVTLLLLAVAVSVASVRTAVPQQPLLWIAYGVCTPLYTAMYAASLTTMFRAAATFAIYAGYLLPILAFVGALFWRRAAVATRIAAIRQSRRPAIARGLGWLALSLALGGVVRTAQPYYDSPDGQSVALLCMMAALAGLAVVFVLDIVVLLTETGAVFRAFVTRMAHRIVPIFSFVVVFVFAVVVFAALYAVLDRFSGAANFSVGGDQRPIDFALALYFSFVTLSTIGYGDITPVTNVARLIVMGEIIFGVVLMLFAFSEIAAYDPDAPERDKKGS